MVLVLVYVDEEVRERKRRLGTRKVGYVCHLWPLLRRIIEDWGLDETWTVTVRYRLSGHQAGPPGLGTSNVSGTAAASVSGHCQTRRWQGGGRDKKRHNETMWSAAEVFLSKHEVAGARDREAGHETCA